MKTMRKRTLSMVFLLAVMLVCLVCPEGAKAAQATQDTFESYTTRDGKKHEEGKGYSIPYILKNYNVFTTGDCEVSHVVGPVIVGGNFHKGKEIASLGGLTTDVVDALPHHVPSYVGSTIRDGQSVSEKIDINYFNENLYFYTGKKNNLDYRVVYTPGQYHEDRTYITDSFILRDVMDDIVLEIEELKKKNTGNIIDVLIDKTSPDYLISDDLLWTTEPHLCTLYLDAGKMYNINFSELKKRGVDTININATSQNVDVVVFTDETTVEMPHIIYNKEDIGSNIEKGKNTGLVFMAPNATNFFGPKENHGGHIVAPKAAVNLRDGDFAGCIIAKEIHPAADASGYSEGHMWPYNGKMLDGKPSVIKTGSLKVTKTVVDGTPDDLKRAFNFTITYTDKNGTLHQDEHFTLTHGGNKTFSDLLADSKYTVTEATDSMFDSSSSNATGTIPEGKTIEAKFTNTKIKPVTVILKAKKLVDGKPAVGNDFSFILKDNGKEYTANNNGETVTFKELTFDKAGNYTYTIAEDTLKGPQGYNYDDSVYDVNVDVSLHAGKTALTAMVTYTKVGDKVGSSEGPTFNNTTKKSATGCLTITNKVIGDGIDPNKPFTYTVTYVDENGNKQTLPEKITLKHNESKSIQGLPVGVTYTVTETNANTDGYVVKGSDSQIAITIESKCVEVPFINIKPAAASVTFEASKTLDGKAPAGNAFSFVLKDQTGKVLQTKKNNGGKIAFDALTFNEKGTYTYTIAEDTQNGPQGYNYDKSVYDVNVEVSLPNGQTTYNAAVTYKKNNVLMEPVFNNTTKTAAGCLTITNTVTGDGSDPNKAFHYTVTYVDGNGATQTVAEFALKHGETKIINDLPVGVEYTITEIDADQDGYIITVASKQKLTTVSGQYVEVPFNNFKPAAASVTFEASKTLDGKAPAGNAFSFVLKDQNGKVLQTKKNNGGKIAFDALTFNEKGTFIYTLTEAVGTDNQMQYDAAVYQATVVVALSQSDNGYHAAVSYQKDGKPYSGVPAFDNRVKLPPEQLTSVSAKKVWNDYEAAKRPASVTVQLYKSGMAYGNPVELNAQNGWKTVWNGLDSKASWSVNELNVPVGYEKTIAQDGNNWTITNTYKAPVDEEMLEDLPKTGDSSNLKLLFALGCLSILGVAVISSKKR